MWTRSTSARSITCRVTRSSAKALCSVTALHSRHQMIVVRIPPHHSSRGLMNCSAAMPGLKAALEAIDSRSDFKTFMQNYAFAHGGVNNKGPRRDGPREEGFVGLPCTVSPRIVLTATRHSSRQSPRSLRTRLHQVHRAHRFRRTAVDRRSVSTWLSRWHATTPTCRPSW